MITYAGNKETGEIFFEAAADTSAGWAKEETDALLEIGASEKNRAYNLALMDSEEWDGTENGWKPLISKRREWQGGGHIYTAKNGIGFLVKDATDGKSNIGRTV